MVSAKVIIRDPMGIHLRPAGMLSNEVIRFQSSVTFQTGHSQGNAKSMLSVLGAKIRVGDEVTFFCEGPDERAALIAVMAFVDQDRYECK